jgi:hypothetical protein
MYVCMYCMYGATTREGERRGYNYRFVVLQWLFLYGMGTRSLPLFGKHGRQKHFVTFRFVHHSSI